VGKLIRNIEKRETMKIREKEKKESISIFFSEVRGQVKEKYSSYIEWRSQDVEKDRTRQDK
jgi:phage-related minor tail protein